jgi:hypothetical protein
MAPMITRRSSFATCCVGSDIYVMGGNISRERTCDLVEKYDSLTDTWTEMAPMRDPCANHCAALVGKKIYVIGEGDACERSTRYPYLQVYDIVKNSWTVLRLGINVSNAQTCVSGTNIYLFGGKNERGKDDGDVKKFDTVTHVWTTLTLNFVLDPSASRPYDRLRGSVNKIGEHIYLTSPDGGNMFLFDPKKETISPVESKGPRVGGYTYVLDGCIYDVFWTYLGRTKNVVSKGTIDVDDNDDHTITWTRVETLPGDAREMFGAASIKNRDVLHVAINHLRRET